MIPFCLAVHEAGHAMAQWYSGISFRHVRVRPRGEWEDVAYQGSVEGHRIFNAVPGFVVRPSDEDFPRKYRSGEIEIFHNLAGPIAEAKQTHSSLESVFNRGGKGDFNHSQEIAQAFSEPVGSQPMVEEGIRRAKALFRDTGMWKTTLAVAKELQTRQSLNWKQVCKIVKKQTGLKERDYCCLADKTDW